jgi:CRISPR-associated protein Cas1
VIKKTLYFANPAYLKTRDEQLVIQIINESDDEKSVPIEDIGLLIIDHPQITITQGLLAKCMENNVAVVTCDQTHHPAGILFNMEGNTLQSQVYKYQLEATIPLKKQLWQQTIVAKIENQASLLKSVKEEYTYIKNLVSKVKSGDTENCEAKAASYYWKRIFPAFLEFRRERYGPPPNNLLNYGYAILRAAVSRAIVGSGLLPAIGIHHKNQYNAFCLSDDIMEPYRPYVDLLVYETVSMNGKFLEMTPSMKKKLLSIPTIDVVIDGKKSPLLNAVSRTTASLVKCYQGESRRILYPVMS